MENTLRFTDSEIYKPKNGILWLFFSFFLYLDMQENISLHVLWIDQIRLLTWTRFSSFHSATQDWILKMKANITILKINCISRLCWTVIRIQEIPSNTPLFLFYLTLHVSIGLNNYDIFFIISKKTNVKYYKFWYLWNIAEYISQQNCSANNILRS